MAAASKIAPYVAAVDVNMGCPVHFSTSGGMGSALLRKPETVQQILTALVAALPCPVTCKIRLLGALNRASFVCSHRWPALTSSDAPRRV